MKATSPTVMPADVDAGTRGSAMSVWMELFKARLSGLVVLTTLAGFYVGYQGAMDWGLLLHSVCGTTLLAFGAAALNQLIEHEHDALMSRTENRPLPAKRLTPSTVLWVGVAVSVIGFAQLYIRVNPLTALLGALTSVSYLLVYTPLKRVTSLNTAIGAIPGALPPLMGWTAARGRLSVEGWGLFAILFFWQLPHFMAIAWMYREEYRKAGFAMLAVEDEGGHRTAGQALSHTLGLLPVSLTPFAFGLAGKAYFVTALLLGLAFLYYAFRFYREVNRANARRLFFASIIYLPLLLVMMVIDKTKL
ncbi:MAG: protoheme IX farnesyltransferase [Verrucomicrobia bacterium]|nr:protoheme IX farnesyltransferase [Verrucomicrobiota bacterium]MBI3870664.1 protoheme IX farnesyltransferase [Verrucomicrobiota bacterium]